MAIAFIIVFLVVLAILCFYFTKKAMKANAILKNYPKQVNVLLNRNVQEEGHLNIYDIKKILTLDDSEWESWKSKTVKAKEIADRYPLAFDEFVSDKAEKSKYSPTKISRHLLIDKLPFDYIKSIVSEGDAGWESNQKIIDEANNIRQTNNLGYIEYLSSRSYKVSNVDIIHDRAVIEQYQKRVLRNRALIDWEEKQKAFSSSFYEYIKAHRPDDGRFVYNIDYNRTAINGGYEKGTFHIWQGFSNSFSPHLLEQQDNYYIESYNKLKEFRRKVRHFNSPVYDGIANIIDSVRELQDEKPLVIFINNSTHGWGQEVYKYHYDYLRRNLADNDYPSCDLSELSRYLNFHCESPDQYYKTVFVIDLITSYTDLENNCKLMLDLFDCNIPCIAYYTLIKEYTLEETKKYAITPPEKREKQNIENVKKIFSMINKHSFFSYIAITNTLVGTAGNADRVKNYWLNNPSQYYFCLTSGPNGYICGQFSTDGGEKDISFSEEGSPKDIDDVAKYTYHLFTRMGIFKQFLEKGDDLVKFFNDNNLLSRH